MGLSFETLREANKLRLPTFKNAKGEPAHAKADGSDWKLSAWSNAVLGELGEAANIIKKIERGDMSLEEARPALAEEFADVVTYLDLLATQAGIFLGVATYNKFNKVSKRVKSPIRMSADVDGNVVVLELIDGIVSELSMGDHDLAPYIEPYREQIKQLQIALAFAEGAIQRAAMAMGSTDEWTDQASMIADFEQRFAILMAKK